MRISIEAIKLKLTIGKIQNAIQTKWGHAKNPVPIPQK